MKLLAFCALFLMASSAFAHNETYEKLISAQEQIINLQAANARLSESLVQSYSARQICYDSKVECDANRDEFRALSSSQVSILTTCRREYFEDQSAACYGSKWVLSTSVRILK